MAEFRHREPPVKNIIMAGKPNMTYQLAKLLLESENHYNIRILEETKVAAKDLSRKLGEHAVIIEGDFTSEDALESSGISTCDLYLSLSEDDENNIMSALLAKKLGAARTIALVNRKAYGDLMQGDQIDITVSTSSAALGELIRHVRRGDVVSAFSLRRGVAEALEIIAHGDKHSSKVIGRRIDDIALPEGCNIGAIIRDTGDGPVVLMGEKETVIEAEDHVIIFVASKRLLPKIERLFTVDVGFF